MREEIVVGDGRREREKREKAEADMPRAWLGHKARRRRRDGKDWQAIYARLLPQKKGGREKEKEAKEGGHSSSRSTV